MNYVFSGDIELSDVDNSFSVHCLSLSPSGDAAIFEIERHEFPETFDPFMATVELGTTTSGGNWISEELKLFPNDPKWGVRIDIKRRRSQFIQGADGAPFFFIVGTWIDYDHNHKSGKTIETQSKFMGLLKGRKLTAPIISDQQEMAINSRFRTRT